jgi:hypothetical protein
MRSIVFVASLTVLSLSASADTLLYDNLEVGVLEDGIDPVENFGPLYDSFSTGSSNYLLDDVAFLLQNLGGPDVGSISVGLYADNSTNPGPLLLTIGTVNDSDVMSPFPTKINLALATPYGLDANTRYWIGLVGQNTTTGWSWSLDQTAPGVAGEFFKNALGTFSNIGGPYQMSVAAASVPEPSGVILLITVLGLIAFSSSWKITALHSGVPASLRCFARRTTRTCVLNELRTPSSCISPTLAKTYGLEC